MSDSRNSDRAEDPNRIQCDGGVAEPRNASVPQPSSQPSTAVVLAVAEHVGADPMEMEPLAHAIDPDALDELFEGARGTQLDQGSVTFNYVGHEVTVDADGSISIA
ncbi:HalOD1 output domain-containing protein [Haloarculaceae archaeon H-GB2-1]|nr:hypothetical protein [Haloarculaceae archaeon H-GB1-1]MEA5387942.1 HalOD1 output domain-containing protein [Haloarculaceae archaeon H-GB11]MEA5409434.1 HalOD1 output domain-containing protein [Haloarculaceae archaeon H-GB2-1]